MGSVESFEFPVGVDMDFMVARAVVGTLLSIASCLVAFASTENNKMLSCIQCAALCVGDLQIECVQEHRCVLFLNEGGRRRMEPKASCEWAGLQSATTFASV